MSFAPFAHPSHALRPLAHGDTVVVYVGQGHIDVNVGATVVCGTVGGVDCTGVNVVSVVEGLVVDDRDVEDEVSIGDSVELQAHTLLAGSNVVGAMVLGGEWQD